jgi:hypothetical protein
MGSSKSERTEKQSERSQQHLPAAPGEELNPFPASNSLTSEDYIEGIGDFAQGLKRMLQRWRRQK